MKATWSAEWRVLRRSPPGRRFQAAYEENRRTGPRSVAHRTLRIILAVIALAIGVVLTFLPGPAVLFFAVAGALLATESRPLAGGLDWAELRLRAILRASVREWRAWPRFGQILAVVLAVTLVTAAGYGSYRLFFG